MLEVRHVIKSIGVTRILEDISFSVAGGETVCLLGASGSGKSTLLRIIAGLDESTSGRIMFNEMDLTDTPPHLRDFGLVFQDYALFPHLNVNDNVAFGLKMRRMEKSEIDERVASSLEMVNLKGFGSRKVTDLSGGEQQRVALARALAIRPRLLLLDEPLGALDRSLRENLINELRTILHQSRIPVVYVTHDQEEAFAIADRIMILHTGRIIREGTPSEVWANPGSVYAAKFLGLGNILNGEIIELGNKVSTPSGIFDLKCDHPHQVGENVQLLVRPVQVTDEANVISGRVTDVIFQQERYKVMMDNGMFFYLAQPVNIGDEISVKVKLECLA